MAENKNEEVANVSNGDEEQTESTPRNPVIWWLKRKISRMEGEWEEREEQHQATLSALETKLAVSNERYERLDRKYQALESGLYDLVECATCYELPRSSVINCCKNGHPICGVCKKKWSETDSCPQCRSEGIDGVSPIAAFVVRNINHKCYFRDQGCDFSAKVDVVSVHEEECPFKTADCPHNDCKQTPMESKLIDHLKKGCAINKMDRPIPHLQLVRYDDRYNDDNDNCH